VNLPSALVFEYHERIIVFPGNEVELPKAKPSFAEWVGLSPIPSYGGKAILCYEGEALYAELYILRLLEASGWDGAWIDTYRRRVLRGPSMPASIPPTIASVRAAIAARAGTEFGSFDVIAWNGSDVLFAEAKRSGHDRIRRTQVRWIAAALEVGIPRDAMLIVEWTVIR
jgi:hypothetical protein